MTSDTHGPLTAYTGERLKTLLSNLAKRKKPYVIEGMRSMQSMDLMSDIGIRSNIIEISAQLLNKSKLDNIQDVFFNLSNIF
jgi:hypothetical protein